MIAEHAARTASAPQTQDLNALRDRMFTYDAVEEQVVMKELLQAAVLDPRQLEITQALAARLAQGVRKARLDAGGVDLLTQEFTLDSREGVALMCLAEAMLRVPDTETRNKLIRDKIVDQDWRSHVGQSPSLFVNATAWGLALTGKVLKQPDENALAAALTNLLRRGGEGVVRTGVSFAMKLLGKQFVTGQTIEDALELSRGREKLGYRFSYDMLGEGALTLDDANGYYEAYAHTIETVGRASEGLGTIDGPGVSVKLTGLHPRYEVAQHARVIDEMYPKLLNLARAAKRWSIGFHLDQEEEARLPLTLEMLERLAHEPELAGWEGLGISLQAYQKRALAVADWLIALGRATDRRMLVRLVKGAYWDTEVRRCQSEGAVGYPVFTRKVHSDVSYLACAKRLLTAPDAIFPQFATHNAFSIAAAHTLAGDLPYEFQCLHGMGESVYDQVVGAKQLGRACRVYAPVGPHATLLAYLVRRLLENGANSSFVNQVVDTSLSIDDVVEDPVAKAARTGGKPHPAVVMPRALLPWRAQALAAGLTRIAQATAPVPINHLRHEAQDAAVALSTALSAGEAWRAVSLQDRAHALIAVAERIEAGVPELQAVLLEESAMTLAEGADELRLAADLCRLHAAQAQSDLPLKKAAPVGPVVLLAPASSPLAWSAGQVAAALVTGNPVILKPASAAVATGMTLGALFHQAGIPAAALQVLAGEGPTFGAALAAQPSTRLVALGGSRAVASRLQAALAHLKAPPVLLARTTAVNAMVVDSSALPEQVITDAVTGAFDGAGRRVGALKVLCVQADVADKILGMLQAMLNERRIGPPLAASSDIGPLRGAGDAQLFERYLDSLSKAGHAVTRGGRLAEGMSNAYVRPAIVDLGAADRLTAVDVDVIGPVLHVVRWQSGGLPDLLATLSAVIDPASISLHTRIHEAAGEVLSLAKSIGVCVNRAVHAARPGMHLEGESRADVGPSPTGPFYLREFVDGARAAAFASTGPFSRAQRPSPTYYEYPVLKGARLVPRPTAEADARRRRDAVLQSLASLVPSDLPRGVFQQHLAEARAVANGLDVLTLPSLSGEESSVVFLPRGLVACAGPTPADTLIQVLYAFACGNAVRLLPGPSGERYRALLGAEQCELAESRGSLAVWARGSAAVLHGETTSEVAAHAASFKPDGDGRYPWWRLVVERPVVINAAASGGNTQLMVVDEDAV